MSHPRSTLGPGTWKRRWANSKQDHLTRLQQSRQRLPLSNYLRLRYIAMYIPTEEASPDLDLSHGAGGCRGWMTGTIPVISAGEAHVKSSSATACWISAMGSYMIYCEREWYIDLESWDETRRFRVLGTSQYSPKSLVCPSNRATKTSLL